MSTWKALARVRDTRPEDREQLLVEALETLYELGRALDCRPEQLAERIEELQSDAKEARERADDAEATLEEYQQSDENGAALERAREELAGLTSERDALKARLDEVQPTIDAMSDVVAMARKLLTKAEASGVKVRHVRKVVG